MVSQPSAPSVLNRHQILVSNQRSDFRIELHRVTVGDGWIFRCLALEHVQRQWEPSTPCRREKVKQQAGHTPCQCVSGTARCLSRSAGIDRDSKTRWTCLESCHDVHQVRTVVQGSFGPR
jgi:hypothetical protein